MLKQGINIKRMCPSYKLEFRKNGIAFTITYLGTLVQVAIVIENHRNYQMVRLNFMNKSCLLNCWSLLL